MKNGHELSKTRRQTGVRRGEGGAVAFSATQQRFWYEEAQKKQRKEQVIHWKIEFITSILAGAQARLSR